MKKVTLYKSEDGTIFDTEIECIKYEMGVIIKKESEDLPMTIFITE